MPSHYNKLPGIDHGNKREHADDSTPFKQTKSGRGNIFTKKGRIQRIVNKHAKATENLDFAEGIGSIYKDNTKNIEKHSKKKQKLENKMEKKGIVRGIDIPTNLSQQGKYKDKGYYKQTGSKYTGKSYGPDAMDYDPAKNIPTYEAIRPRTKRTLLNEKIRKNKK